MSEDNVIILSADQVEAFDAASAASEDHDALLAELRKRGGHAGNTALMGALGWEQARYWRVRGIAIESGVLRKGRGKGGSVSIVEGEILAPEVAEGAVEEPAAPVAKEDVVRPKESALYAGAHKTIQDTWWREENYDAAIAEVTASQGSKATGGKWTRPDISLAATKSYVYFPEAVFDVVTFEIKPKDQVDVRGVFEAISHREFATRSYVIFEGTLEALEKQQEWQRIVDVAARYGIGVLAAEKMDHYETWEEVTDAKRVTADPANIDKFIRTSLSEDTRTQIIKWQKR